MVNFAKGGDAGIILRLLATELSSCYCGLLDSSVDSGKSTWLHGNPRITRPLSCGINLVNFVRSEEWGLTHLVLVVESLETYTIAKLGNLVVPEGEDG